MSGGATDTDRREVRTQRALHLETVRVVRLPGIDEPFTVDELAPGFNLVFGPNASGKSSLVRAMDAVLWPRAEVRPGYSVIGRFRVGDTPWQVSLDADACDVSADGRPASPLPAPALRHRYRLSLHDLVAASDSDGGFAQAIARASAGGLDVTAAGDAIGALEKPKASPSHRRAYDEALAAWRRASTDQASLFARGSQLDALRRERDDAIAARHAIAALEAARAHRDVRATRDAALAQQRALPAAVSRVTGREHHDALALLDRWRARVAEWADAVNDADAARRDRDAAFAGEPPSDAQRAGWRAALEELTRTAEALDHEEQRLEAARARREQLRVQLGPEVPHAALRRIDHAVLSRLAEFADRYERSATALRVAASEEALAADRAALPPASVSESADALRSALSLLVRWLVAEAQGAPAARTASPLPTALLTLLGALGWAIAAWRWHLASLLGVLASLLLAAWAWRTSSRSTASVADERPMLVRQYAALGVTPPASWSADAVVAHLGVLTERLVARERAARALESREMARRARERAEMALGESERERALLEGELGVSPGAAPRGLGWLVDRVQRWQDAQVEVSQCEAECERLRGSIAMQRDRLVTAIAMPEAAQVASPAALRAVLAEVDTRASRWLSASRALATAESAVRRAHDALEAMRVEWTGVFSAAAVHAPALPLTGDDDGAVQQALRELAALGDARARFDALTRQVSDAEREMARLEAGAGDAAQFTALAALTREELEAHRAEALVRAERADALALDVDRLERDVEGARRTHAVEDALATRDRTREALEAQWDEQLDGLLAHALVQHVQASTRDVHRPAVFHRARTLFTRITHGRWALHLDEAGDVAAFAAEDTRTMRSFALDELSSGTRVQLLVAVRVAFVEHEEDGVRLPLFFDETLGTSDDQRAHALIEAILALVADGRQVFYLTAQADEVAKWRAALAGRDVPWQEVDLAAVRWGASAAEAAPGVRAVPFPVAQRALLPDPTEHTHASYGAALAVPSVAAGVTPIGATPLWYLVDDLRVLHAALLTGIATWGELRSYRASGGALRVDDVPDATVQAVMQRAELAARALEVLHTESRVGRGRPVDRAALQESGAVTPRFVPELLARAEACRGDAAALLDSLEEHRVTGFGTGKVAALRDALTVSGHLATELPRAPHEIRLAMLAATSGPSGADVTDALLERLAARAEARQSS